jgi:hypothetical protein
MPAEIIDSGRAMVDVAFQVGLALRPQFVQGRAADVGPCARCV